MKEAGPKKKRTRRTICGGSEGQRWKILKRRLGFTEARAELKTNKFGRYEKDKEKEEERRMVRIREGREHEMEKELHSTIHSYRRCSNLGNCLTHWRKMNCAMAAGAYHRMVVPYWRFGTTYRSHLQGSSTPSTILCCIKSQNSADLIYVVTEDWSHKHVSRLIEVMKCLSSSSFRRRSNFSSPGAFLLLLLLLLLSVSRVQYSWNFIILIKKKSENEDSKCTHQLYSNDCTWLNPVKHEFN